MQKNTTTDTVTVQSQISGQSLPLRKESSSKNICSPAKTNQKEPIFIFYLGNVKMFSKERVFVKASKVINGYEREITVVREIPG